MNNVSNTMLPDLPQDKDGLYRYTTKQYIESLPKPITLSDEELRVGLMAALTNNIKMRNSMYPGNISLPQSLPTISIADLIMAKYIVACVSWTGDKDDGHYVGIYQKEGPNEGIYVNRDSEVQEIVSRFRYLITPKEIKDVLEYLAFMAPVKKPCMDANLIAVNNGIFNYETKELMDFTPDLVFTRKSRVNYVDSPASPHITMPDGKVWDFDSWIQTLSDDPDIVDLLIKVCGAIIRPNVRWDKIVCMYSQAGMNGKGTLCELMKQLCGEGTYASIPFTGFERDSLVCQLLKSTAVINDENGTNEYAKNVSNLKALTTGDSVCVDRKYKDALTFRYSGLIVECVNNLPRAADQTDSFYRRFLMIPFDKTFKDVERKYIKSDYLHRPEVLEYVLWKVLNLPAYYELPEPEACKALLEDYKQFNDPVVEFVENIVTSLVWNKIPLKFLNDLYNEWFKKSNPSGKIIRSKEFKERLLHHMNTKYSSRWVYFEAPTGINKTDNLEPEMMIIEYGLENWKSKSYSGIDPKKICMPDFSSTYRGVFVSCTQNISSENEVEVES